MGPMNRAAHAAATNQTTQTAEECVRRLELGANCMRGNRKRCGRETTNISLRNVVELVQAGIATLLDSRMGESGNGKRGFAGMLCEAGAIVAQGIAWRKFFQRLMLPFSGLKM